MPTTSLTKYCCAYASTTFQYTNASVNCSNTYTAHISSTASSGGNFGMWGNTEYRNRTCISLQSCSGDTLIFNIEMGCIPKSCYPITHFITIDENGSPFSTLQEVILGDPNLTNCTAGTCPEICS